MAIMSLTSSGPLMSAVDGWRRDYRHDRAHEGENPSDEGVEICRIQRAAGDIYEAELRMVRLNLVKSLRYGRHAGCGSCCMYL